LRRANGDDLNTCMLLSNMSYYYFRLARDFRSYDSSIEYGQQGLALARRLRSVYAEYCAFLALGNSYHTARLSQKAAESFHEALKLARSCGHKIWEYECLAWLSGLYSTMRDNDQALAYAQLEMALATEIGKPGWTIHALNVIGNMHHREKHLRSRQRVLAQGRRASGRAKDEARFCVLLQPLQYFRVSAVCNVSAQIIV